MSTAGTSGPAGAGPRPASPWVLFLAFNGLALQGFGGVLPVAQRVLVEQRGWLTREEFLRLLSLAQVLPGPNVVNLSLMVGDRFFGGRGAAAAMAGMLLAPLIVVLLLAVLAREASATAALAQPMAGALRGMGIVAAGLVLATALKLAKALVKNPLGLVACCVLVGATAVGVGLWRWPLAAVVAGFGALGMALAWTRLDRRRTKTPD